MYIISNGNIAEGVNYQVIGGTINYEGSNYSSYFTGSTTSTYSIISGSPLVYEASEFLGQSVEIESSFYLGLFADESYFKGSAFEFEKINTAEKKYLAPDLIEIFFKSNIDFTNDNEVIKFDDWQVLRKRGSLIKKHIQPFDIIDNVNGKEISVYKEIWDGYYCEFFINENQANLLSIIQACNEILVKDNKNGFSFIADNENSEYFTFEVSEFLAQTSNYRASIIFRTNKKSINLKEAINNDYAINANGNIFYTDIKPADIVEDTDIETIDSDKGIETTISTINKKTLQYTFYLNEIDKNNLKQNYENSINIQALNNGTWVEGLENKVVKIENLTKNFFKCTVIFVYESEIYYNN